MPKTLKKNIKCPYCGDIDGYWVTVYVKEYWHYNWDGSTNFTHNGMTKVIKKGKRKQCIQCKRILIDENS